MIDKQNYYHGAAIMAILDHSSCKQISKHEHGYLINSSLHIFLKYTTKHRTPWRFSFSETDIALINSLPVEKVFIGLVCGGDGICLITAVEMLQLITEKNGWISAKRKYHEQYHVAGTNNELIKKVSLQRWPDLIFQ